MAQVMEVRKHQIANLPGALECPLNRDLRRFLVEAPDADENTGMDRNRARVAVLGKRVGYFRLISKFEMGKCRRQRPTR